jgi:hypothetical protein
MAQLKKRDAKQIAEAIDYKLQGHPYESIAAQMNINVADAKALVQEGLAIITRGSPEEQIILDLQRVDQMLAAVYPTAANGEREAILTMIALRQEREALERKWQRAESFRRLADRPDP